MVESTLFCVRTVFGISSVFYALRFGHTLQLCSASGKKYFTGKKKVTPIVTTIVEFRCPKTLVDQLFAMQLVIETQGHGVCLNELK